MKALAKRLIPTKSSIRYKQKKYKNDKRVLKINAPVVIVPDPKDRPTPVLTDRYFMDDIFKYFEEKKIPLLDHWLEEGKLALVFENKEQTVLFKLEFPGYLTWRENATTVGEGFYDDDYRPDPFPQRNC
jgi:hypothetical protein